MRPPAIAAGIPNSKVANHAVAGLANKPTTSPTEPPIKPNSSAPKTPHRGPIGNELPGTCLTPCPTPATVPVELAASRMRGGPSCSRDQPQDSNRACSGSRASARLYGLAGVASVSLCDFDSWLTTRITDHVKTEEGVRLPLRIILHWHRNS
jgi:hypothetical protein